MGRRRPAILVKGKGINLPDPTLGGVPAPIRVQLHNQQTDKCWESSFGAADVIKNDAAFFKAKVTVP